MMIFKSNKVGFSEGWELAELGVALLLYLGYHMAYFVLFLRCPHRVSLALNLSERHIWVHKVLTPGINETIGVQSIRNGQMSSIFFASTSLLVSYGILSDLLQPSDDVVFPSAAMRLKVMTFGCLFLFAFLAFAFCLRSFGHLTFLINAKTYLPLDCPEDVHLPSSNPVTHFDATHSFTQTQAACNGVISRATVTWWLGMRCFYLTIPLALWFLSFTALLIGMVFTLFILILNDFYFN